MTRDATRKMLKEFGWFVAADYWRGCIHEIYWQHSVTGEEVQQRTAINITRTRWLPKTSATRLPKFHPSQRFLK